MAASSTNVYEEATCPIASSPTKGWRITPSKTGEFPRQLSAADRFCAVPLLVRLSRHKDSAVEPIGSRAAVVALVGDHNDNCRSCLVLGTTSIRAAVESRRARRITCR